MMVEVKEANKSRAEREREFLADVLLIGKCLDGGIVKTGDIPVTYAHVRTYAARM